MTFNNSILLILKQSGSLEFNEIFSKISSRYKNQKSAYASLRRALKNLDSFGLVNKQGTRFFITDKGLASVQVEMKEKLVLKLNEDLKKPLDNIEEIVQLLIVFTERANETSDLLQNARENATFTIKDISELQEKIEERKGFLDKMASLIGVQEERLRELDFNDCVEFDFDEKFVKKALHFIGNEKVILEVRHEELLNKIPELWQKENSIIVENEFKEKIFEILLKQPLFEFTLYLPKIKCFASKGKINCYAPFNTLKEFKKLK